MKLRDKWGMWVRKHDMLVFLIIAVLFITTIWIVGLALSFTPNEIGAFISILAIINSVIALIMNLF